MGVDKAAVGLPLLEMYVPLRARIETLAGESWDRTVRLGGSQLPAEATVRLTEPQPVLALLQEHAGLIILGDPGAGKTTFLKYLALKLALGQGDDLNLPHRLPILVPLSAYAKSITEHEIPLDEFISQYYNDLGIDLPLADLFHDTLQQGKALFLLDGLDEVQSLTQRSLVVDRFLDFFAFYQQTGNKFALTSRIIGFAAVRPQNELLKECTLADFDRSEIELFVDKWTAALEKSVQGAETSFTAAQAKQEKSELLEAVDHHDGVRKLATNPLLLTILALMKRQGVTLPDQRVQLYNNYIETLIKHWNLVRSLHGRVDRLLDYGETVEVLAELALWMHQENPGISLAPQEEVKRQLVNIYRQRDETENPEKKAQQLLKDAREYAGLLVERGQREYGFIHLTFQEYLAAIGISLKEEADLKPVAKEIARHVGNDNWHEVTLLAIAYIGIIQQRTKPASRVLEMLIQQQPGELGEAVVLAGQAVADMSPGGITAKFKQTIFAQLIQTMQTEKVEIQRRAQAGKVLGQISSLTGVPLDNRDGVSFIIGADGQKIPDIAWGKELPADKYVIGGDEAAFGESDEQEITIDQPFKLAKYPITYAQFQCFLDANDFMDSRWWQGMPEEDESLWKVMLEFEKNESNKTTFTDEQKEEYYQSRKLHYLFSQQYSYWNHPRENVSWYQAIAFCRWLGAKLELAIDLPHEYEWEVAARFPDSRFYPWGNEFDSAKANTSEGDINRTTAVGLYPAGANKALDLYDLSGNVWEWCRNKYQNPADTKVDDSGATRTLRGGSWAFNLGRARLAYRFNLPPADRGNGVGFRLVVRRPPSQ